MGIQNIKKRISRYGLFVAGAQWLAAFGIIKEEKLERVMEKHYYSKLTKDDMYRELTELYNLHGLDDDIRHPTTFTGKINWIKINGDLDTMAKLADKYLVKKWVQEKIGEKYLIKTLGVWEKVDDIDFESLPDQFVFKANHGCGFIYVVRNKSKENWKELKKVLQKWLDTSFGWVGLEIHYLRIPRRIIAEEYIAQIDGNLFDYKVHCFDGEPTLIHVIGDRDIIMHKGMEANYDFDWNRLPWDFCDYIYPAYTQDLPKPNILDELYSVSKELCEGFAYVRVDLYIVGNCVKFGEMTFTPGCGNYRYQGTWNRKIDKQLGAMIPINTKE